MRALKRPPQFRRRLCRETRAAPVTRQLRIRPRRDVEQLAPLGDRPENAPSAIVDDQHDRIGAELQRMRDLLPRHLKRAVTA